MDDVQTAAKLEVSDEIIFEQVGDAKIALKTKFGKYLGFNLNDGRHNVWGNATRVGGYERMSLHLLGVGTELKVAIVNKDGDYLGFKLGLGVWVDSRFGSYEEMTIKCKADGTYALFNKDDHWLEFTSDGGIDVDND